MSRVLEGMTAFVTGANGAIATASATLFARDGATLVLMGRSESGLGATAAGIRQAVPDAQIHLETGDARDEAAVERALRAAHAVAGRLDIVLATVGGGGFRPLLMLDVATLRQEFEINVVSAFLAIRHGAPLMSHGGSIVCISSGAATRPFGYLPAYHIAKSGVEALVRGAAEELGSAGIRVNAVRPGLTKSNDTSGMFGSPEVLERFLPEYPLGRLGSADDIAGAVRFLAGPESGWMTGQSFAVDGGNELRRNPDMTPLLEALHGAETVAKLKAGKAP